MVLIKNKNTTRNCRIVTCLDRGDAKLFYLQESVFVICTSKYVFLHLFQKQRKLHCYCLKQLISIPTCVEAVLAIAWVPQMPLENDNPSYHLNLRLHFLKGFALNSILFILMSVLSQLITVDYRFLEAPIFISYIVLSDFVKHKG